MIDAKSVRRGSTGALLCTLALGFAPAIVQAQDVDSHCAAVAKSVADAGFGDKVSVTCSGGQALMASSTYPDHPLAQKKYVDTKDIANEPLVLLNGGFFVNRLIYQNFQQALTAPKVILHSSQLHTVKNLISSQIASSFLMRQAITASDNIIPLSLKKPLFINSGIVTKRGRQIYGDEQKLIEFICDNQPLG